ncbi:hypothetical protein R1flu_019692 [Riccia fluitans]|uniref:FAD-binding domain-containing protein n=1 Tax=Riccia fluitans TaxID=41844 RepID=A0ABD1ZMV8_9MARC
MASTLVTAIDPACSRMATVSMASPCEKRSDFEIRRLSSSFCSSSGICSLRTTFRQGDRCRAGPWRLTANSSRRRAFAIERCAVARSQAVSSDSRVKTGENIGENDPVHELIIVGAGIAGLAAAVAMNKIGVKSLVLEQSAALRTTGSALGVWSNGWRVLDVLGIADRLRAKYSPISGGRFFDQQGNLLKGFELDECPEGPHELRGVERKFLVETLASLLPPETIRFNNRVVTVKTQAGTFGPIELSLSDGSVVKTKVLLGADGVNSVVAKWMGFHETRYVGYIGIRGLAEYPDGQTYGSSVRQYIGAGSRVGVLPISPTQVYWFITYNKSNPGPKIQDPNELKTELLDLFKTYWPGQEIPVHDLLAHTPVESLSRAALRDRWNLPGSPPVVQSGVTLAGDALHPMTPNLGQGGCCALEDAVILAQTLGQVLLTASEDGDRITKALEEYAAERNRRTLPLTVRAFVMGSLLQISFPPVVFVRDKIAIPKMVNPNYFLGHTLYDAGQLPVVQRAPVNK